MIIGIANGKGGVGKSTLSRNGVVYLNDRGFRTALVDAEEHSPTARLVNQFDKSIETRSAVSLDEIDDAVQDLDSKGFHVIIDAPGKEGDQVSTLCLLSDLVIVPMCLSETDILQTVPVLNLVRRQQKRSRDGLPEALIVFNKTHKNDAVAEGVRKRFESFQIPVSQTQIRYLKSIGRMTSVMRQERYFQEGGPATDFKEFIDREILSRFRKVERSANG